MSYIAESLDAMGPADLRAWALSQIGPGYLEDRLTEAEKLIDWLFSTPSMPVRPGPLNHGKSLSDVRDEELCSIDGEAKVSDRNSNGSICTGLSCCNGCVNNSAIMPEGYDIIDEKSGSIIGFHASNPSSYRLEKRVRRHVCHKDSSSVTGEESGDSAATDPRNDATPGGGARHV